MAMRNSPTKTNLKYTQISDRFIENLKGNGVASYEGLGHVGLPTISIFVHSGVNLTANYPNIV